MASLRGKLYAGVELGGTKCVCICASGPDRIVTWKRIPTADPEPTLAAIATTLEAWQNELGPLDGVGIASFGPIELDRARPEFGRIVGTSKPSWSGADVLGAIAGGLDIPVGLDTDVNGAALAEGEWGAARGLQDYAYVTVGTGIGVGLIVGGRPVSGFSHAELGHIRVARSGGDSWPGACHYHGDCVEGLASGAAIEARVGKPAGSLDGDDPVWDLVAAQIALLLQTLVLATAPRKVILGGGVMDKQPHLLDRIAALLDRGLNHYGVTDRIAGELHPYVVPPLLGDLAGPLGAIALAAHAGG